MDIDLKATLSRLKLNENFRPHLLVSDDDTPATPVKDAAPKDNSSDDQTDDSDDSDDANDPADKQFDATPAIKPIVDQFEKYGEQCYIMSELLKQVEGYKGLSDKDNMNDALNGFKEAMQDATKMQSDLRTSLIDYLKQYVPKD